MARRRVRRRYEVPPGTYRVEWANVNPAGKSYVDFEYKGGSWSNFDDAWMDVFVIAAVPKVTQDGEKMGEMHQFAAETLGKKSCCCGATEKLPCECMKLGVMQCSSQPPRCPCYQAIKEDEDWAEHGFPEEESYMSTEWLKRKLGIKSAEGYNAEDDDDEEDYDEEEWGEGPGCYICAHHVGWEEANEADAECPRCGAGGICNICADAIGEGEGGCDECYQFAPSARQWSADTIQIRKMTEAPPLPPEVEKKLEELAERINTLLEQRKFEEAEKVQDELYELAERAYKEAGGAPELIMEETLDVDFGAEDAEDYGVQPTWMAETQLDSTNLTDWANANDTDDMKYLIGGFIGGIFATAIGAIAGEWTIQKFKGKGWL